MWMNEWLQGCLKCHYVHSACPLQRCLEVRTKSNYCKKQSSGSLCATVCLFCICNCLAKKNNSICHFTWPKWVKVKQRSNHDSKCWHLTWQILLSDFTSNLVVSDLKTTSVLTLWLGAKYHFNYNCTILQRRGYVAMSYCETIGCHTSSTAWTTWHK